ncbi:unnamed protein product, partial [Ectocarpus fasciculatus]
FPPQELAHGDNACRCAGASRRVSIRLRCNGDSIELRRCCWRDGSRGDCAVGAGMDTRGLRLRASGDTKVFEVDQALVLRVKTALLKQAAAVDEVAAAVAGF